VWASRPGRIAVLRGLVRKMLVIFPFEETLYREAGVPVEFVGHPLLDRVPEPAPALRSGVVGLLPGSRASELRRHLPILFEAFRRLRESRPALEGVLFAAPSQPDAAYGTLPPGVRLVRERDYAERATVGVALCASGTATLENALLGIPMVVVYRLSWPEYRIARALIRVPHVAMANLLAGRAIVPELIQGDATPERVAAEAGALLDDPARHAAMRGELLALRGTLGEAGAADRPAGAIVASVGEGR
jgi:lipid-A-disaccharide synthase